MAHAIEGGDTTTKQPLFFYSTKSVVFRREARRGTAHYRLATWGATARVSAPPLPPSFAPIPPPGRYWCCFIAHHHPTQPCLPSVRPLLLSQVPMPPPSLRTWGCYCAGICAPPIPPSFAPIPPRGPYTTSRKLRPTPDLPGPSSVHFLRPLSPALPPLTVCPRLHTRPTAPHGCTHHDVRLMPRLITTISYS